GRPVRGAPGVVVHAQAVALVHDVVPGGRGDAAPARAERDRVVGAGRTGVQPDRVVVGVGVLLGTGVVDVVHEGLGGSGPLRDDAGLRGPERAAAAELVGVVLRAGAQALDPVPQVAAAARQRPVAAAA